MYQKIAEGQLNQLQSQKEITILGIETSCDETAAAVVRNGRTVLSNIISSQIEIHRKFGGVVPEVASRNHLLSVNTVIEEALSKAGVSAEQIDAVAITVGAGLAGALLVGVSAAKAAAYALQKPLIAVNHIESHIAANFIAHHDLQPPFLALVASGGHTGIIAVAHTNDYQLLGGTVDDAIGEAFDKVARLLGLPYPGGPEIEKLAREGTACISFYKTEKGVVKDLRLSYSGLKTAVVNYVNTATMKGEAINKADVCASFTKAAVDSLVQTAVYAAEECGYKQIVLAGGVAANGYLRLAMQEAAGSAGIKLFVPPLVLCTDNAAMVASRAYFSVLAGTDLADLSLNADSGLKVRNAE